MKTKTVRNELLKFRKDEYDGQDYETVANLIKGNQYLAAGEFIYLLDTSPRDHMRNIIAEQPSLYDEVFPEEKGYYYEISSGEKGIWSDFAEEGLYGPYHNEEGVLQ